ncbi:ADP-ribosylglycohydrolase family protein [Cohnella fermenti]|uniref:ADP-ribosylglycohydrolase family protein n=1 Tax=Cohnella fermenti TaxID=2565925 RepID=UPI001454D745|nr:ADP-ribosylglycohydrolase family protein [Cohnella fermenti]
MNEIILNEQDYYDKVYGGWLGKNIGGTLGVPVEGVKELLDLSFYPVLPDEPLENDDLDLQLVWLHALEQYGARLTARELGQEWVEHIFFPFDEYGYALANLRRGLTAPISGWFNNPFKDCMGSPIRSEIWAMVAPGAPERAAAYAYEDAIVDHAGGEGVYGEMFFAAIESAAFVESDRDALIRIGLSYIPEDCRTARAVKDLLAWHAEGIEWKEARRLILEHHGDDNFTDAPQNIAFTILGWLYGEDFGDALLKATNCGYDTDCTAATLGAILGIIGGRDSLPERWVAPVGDRVVVSPPIKGFPAPADLNELTERTMHVGREVIAAWQLPVSLSAAEPTSGGIAPRGPGGSTPLPSPRQNRYLLPRGAATPGLGLELTVDYGAEGPVIERGGSRRVAFALENRSRTAWQGEAELILPSGWKGAAQSFVKLELEPGGTRRWEVEVAHVGIPHPRYELTLLLRRRHDGTVWSTEALPLTLVPAMQWTVAAPDGTTAEAAFPGNLLDFEAELGTAVPGVYKAAATVVVPTGRKVRWIAATEGPTSLRIDGREHIRSDAKDEFMPAFHRSPPGKFCELEMEAGTYRLELEVTKGAGPLKAAVAAVGTAATDSPGPHYAMTDILFLP